MKLATKPVHSNFTEAVSASVKPNSSLHSKSDWFAFEPSLSASERKELNAVLTKKTGGNSTQLRQLARRRRELLPLASAALILADLLDQGWSILVKRKAIWLSKPALAEAGEDLNLAKSRIRASLKVGRDRQLRTPAVQDFLARMLRPKKHHGRYVSVIDLVDDGPELAALLNETVTLPLEQRPDALNQFIQPVVELAATGVKDPETGLDLFDIWRFFRHTWSLEYRSVPGRSLAFLVRNAARPNRPVIGLGMLASSPRLTLRDRWIGWELEPLTRALKDGGLDASEVSQALYRGLTESLSLVRWDDLITQEQLARPDQEVIEALIKVGHQSRLKRKSKEPQATKNIAIAVDGDTDWLAASELPLFKQKRALLLSKLLSAVQEFHSAGFEDDPGSALRKLLSRAAGKRAVSFALAELRKAGMATAVPDLSVCGAAAPYNEIMGGKLVAALMASEEVRQLYNKRYSGQESVIASQMAGRAVSRPVDLMVITTTSLYGVGSSQYNRLHLRATEHPELPFDVRWERLGLLQGVGSVHLSSATVNALRHLTVVTDGHRWVNNVFGEGVNPRLRQIRQGLEALGVPPDIILNHGNPRILYACEVYPGARRKLMGLNCEAKSAATVGAISTAWLRRWVSKRVDNNEVLDRMASLTRETFTARLYVGPEGQPPLF